MELQFEWHKEGFDQISEELEKIRMSNYSWILKTLKANKSIYINNIEEIPESDKQLKNWFRKEHVQSLRNFSRESLADVIGGDESALF